MIEIIRGPLVLSLYPNSNGVGYALFEGECQPVDWGIKTARSQKHETILRHASYLIQLFRPDMLLLPSRRAFIEGSRRLQTVSDEIATLANRFAVPVRTYSRDEIKRCFAKYGAKTKDDIARVIAHLMPELEQHLPPVRMLWMSEDYRMGIFDAVASAASFYSQHKTEPL